MAAKYAYGNDMNSSRPQGWLLAAVLLVPLTLGLACSSVSSDSQQPELHTTGPIGNATFEQLVKHSNAIIVGTVTDITAAKDNTDKDYRRVTLNVEQTIRGESAGQVVVNVPGNDADNGTDTVKCTKGERVLLLLDMGTGQFTIEGRGKGKFSIDGNNMINNVALNDFISNIKSILAGSK